MHSPSVANGLGKRHVNRADGDVLKRRCCGLKLLILETIVDVLCYLLDGREFLVEDGGGMTLDEHLGQVKEFFDLKTNCVTCYN